MILNSISSNENFEYGYSHSNALFGLKLEHCKLHEAEYHPTKCDVINDIKLFPTVIGYLHECDIQQHKKIGPTPWGPGEGSKGQISLNFKNKVNFKDFLYQTCACSNK